MTKNKIGIINILRGEIKWKHTNAQLKLKWQNAEKDVKKQRTTVMNRTKL